MLILLLLLPAGCCIPFQVVLATKITGGSNITRESIIRDCEGSLERLQTDYIDVYQTHWPARQVFASDGYGDCGRRSDSYEYSYILVLMRILVGLLLVIICTIE